MSEQKENSWGDISKKRMLEKDRKNQITSRSRHMWFYVVAAWGWDKLTLLLIVFSNLKKPAWLSFLGNVV